ncbi:hypothetical protein SUGI_0926940 [Cryptomeria japonica]|nr:hypothetical protein SUGI_0926940 [Cryptomeria japonica]
MESETHKAACEKQKGDEQDAGLRKHVKWRILEVDWNKHGPKFPRKDILAWVENNWGKHIMIKFLPKGFFVAVFLEEEDRDHIISLQNWFLNEYPLYIQPWSPKFDPTSLMFYDKPVWI